MTDLDLIIRDVCEAEPSDPEHKDTVCIGVEYLRDIIERHLERIGHTSRATPADHISQARDEAIEECAMVCQRFADCMIGNTEKGAALRSMVYSFADDIRALTTPSDERHDADQT